MAKKQIGEVDYNVEFNDSVLSTKTWNNPRYDGCKTETQELNKFTPGDTTYGKTPAVQKYTRNIYVGDQIVPASGSEDPNLVPFSGFSYLMATKYITINDLDDLEENTYEGTTFDDKEGFYRTFTEDFTPTTACKVYLLDENIQNSLKEEYNVYFSQGRLKKIAHFTNLDQENSNNGAISPSGDYLFTYAEDVGDPFVSFSIFSHSDLPETWNGPYGSVTTGSVVEDFFTSTVTSYQASPNNRYFFTLTQGPEFPLVTSSIGTSLDTPILAQTGSGIVPALSQLSTAEYYTVRSTSNIRYVNFMDKFRLTKPYFDDSYGDHGGYPYGGAYYMGYYVSKLNTSIPSVLVNLNKDEQLPNGLVPGNIVNNTFQVLAGGGGAKFVIIPENLHPYIKDNIKYFLSKAGLYDTAQPLTKNSRNRQLS